MSSKIPALYIWRDHLEAWRPLHVGVSPRGRLLAPALRDRLGELGFHVHLVDLEVDDQPLIDAVGAAMPSPGVSLAGSLPGDARESSFASSAVPAVYVWSDLSGAWSPLLIAITATGRRYAAKLAALLGDLGVPTWLHGVPQDDTATIYAASRLLRPPSTAAFIDFAPDGILDHDVVALSVDPN